MEERITELEIRLTHIEDTMDALNRAVVDLHKIIDDQKLQIEILEKKIQSLQESNIAHESEETPPPHY